MGEEQNFWRLKGNRVEEYAGIKLQELYAYYSNRLSYYEVENLVERVTGEKQLSDQGIWAEVKEKVAEISHEIVRQVKPILEQLPAQKLRVNPQIDLYNPQQEEILLFEDGILVKGQKAERESRTQLHKSRKKPSAEDRSQKFYQTDVVLLQKAQGGYEYMTTPIDAQGKVILSLGEVLKAKMVQEYGLGTSEQPLNLVAIADGAKSIRCRLESVFGEQVTLILDWYHLSRKVRKLMGSVARNQAEKSEYLKFLLSNLWQGKVAIAIEYLHKQVKTKKQEVLKELINYLSKHQSEIINYQRRQKAGKPIGSGRVEKAVDLVVGHRQKKKGMSWSAKGSQALAVLRVAELNRQWGAIFGMNTSAL